MEAISLKKNIGWSFIGNVTYNVCQWAVLIALAKFTSPTELGQFALAVAIAAPVFTFSNLQLRTILVSDINNLYSFSEYCGLRVICSIISFLLVCVIGVFSTEIKVALIVIIIFASAKFFDSLSDLAYGLIQRHERMDQISKSLMIRGIVSLCAMIILLYLTNSVIAAVLCYLFVWGSVFWFFDKRNALLLVREKYGTRSLKPEFDMATMRALFLFSLPLAFVVFLNAINMNIPRYTISSVLGEADLGIFAAIASFMVVGSTMISAVAQSALPRLTRYYANDRSEYLKLLSYISAIALGVGVSGVFVAWLVGEPVLRIVFTPEYARHGELLVWIMFAAIPLYLASIAGLGIAAARRFRAQALVTAASTIVVLLAAVLLVPEKGIVGGAIALGCGFTVKWIGQLAIVCWMSRSSVSISFLGKA